MRSFLIWTMSLLLAGGVVKAESLPLEDVIAEVNPSVVNIAADLGDSRQALGAGIIVSVDGYVVTNAHVVEDAKKIILETSENEIFSADLLGTDAKTDIALLKIKKPLNLEMAHFGNSDGIRVGNQVFAIGNPFGLGNSVSLGIISAKERDIEKGPYDNFLQTDATINQGNSGGPLFNRDGKIIGMNTAIFSNDGQNTGIGFATPSNMIVWVVEQLKAHGHVIRGWLGVGIKKIHLNTEETALVISSMVENSPAAKAGLKVGDKIESFGNMPLTNPRLFSSEVAKITPGTEIKAVISRDGKIYEYTIKIGEEKEENKTGIIAATEEDIPLKGFSEMGIDKYKIREAQYFSSLGFSAYYDETEKQFAVISVKTGSAAEAKGIKAGDRLLKLNGKTLFGYEDLKTKIKTASEGRLSLTMSDEKEIYSITLEINEKND